MVYRFAVSRRRLLTDRPRVERPTQEEEKTPDMIAMWFRLRQLTGPQSQMARRPSSGLTYTAARFWHDSVRSSDRPVCWPQHEYQGTGPSSHHTERCGELGGQVAPNTW